MAFTERAGLTAAATSSAGQVGYDIATQQTNDGKPYTVLSATGSQGMQDPANLVVTVHYAQTVEFQEVDLELRYTDIPTGTEVALDSTDGRFSIARKPISGTALISAIAKGGVAPFEADFKTKLWVTKPELLKSTSVLTLSVYKIIEEGGGVPVKKTLLQKLQINLAIAASITPTDQLALADPTLWPGIVVRNSVSEKGTVPRPSSSQSPDIIVSGKMPFEDPSFLTKPENYNNSYANTLYIGFPNYVYVRGKNFTSGDLSGSWNLFWATPNILLYPYLWQENQLATSNGNMNPPFQIKAGQIGASTDAFNWVPPNTSDHYCMIAIANTPGHGNPLEGVTNVTSLAEVLATNGNIAQRNLQLVRGAVPQLVSKAAYSQGSEGALMDLTLVFEYIPIGSAITVSSGTPLNGTTLSYKNDKTTETNYKWGWINQDVPANWETMFNYTIFFGTDWSGIPVGKRPTITIRGELITDETHRLYHLGYDPGPHPVTGKVRLSKTGGPVRVIRVGEVSTMAVDVGP